MAAADPLIRDAASRLGRDPSHQFRRRMPVARFDASLGRATPDRPHGRRFGIFAWSVLLLALAIGGLAIVGGAADLLFAREETASTTPIEVVIGNDVLNIPANAIRFRQQRAAGIHDRIDLYLRWPALDGYRADADADFHSETVNPNLILVSLTPRAMRLDMSGRVEPIYSQFLEGPAEAVGHGLAKRALATSGGYVDEDLYFEENSPYPYASRCIRMGSPVGTPYCLRDIHLGRNLTVTYRFHVSLIGDWMAIEAAIRARIQAMLAG